MFATIVLVTGTIVANPVLAQSDLPDVYHIPNWVKKTSMWWSEEKIDDNSFLHGIEYMIQKGIMKIPSPEEGQKESIPFFESSRYTNKEFYEIDKEAILNMSKFSVNQWAKGQVDDSIFVRNMQDLIIEKIMKINERVCPQDKIWNGKKCADNSNLNNLCSSLPDSKRKLCENIFEQQIKNKELFVKSKVYRIDEQKNMEYRAYIDRDKIVQDIRQSDAIPEYLCAVRDTGIVQCAPFSYVLASFDAQMGQFILQDIEKLAEDLGIDVDGHALFRCGNGLWDVIDTPDPFENLDSSTSTGSNSMSSSVGSASLVSEIPSISEVFTLEKTKSMIDICSNLRQNDNRPTMGGAGSFSGITGIDDFPGMCAFGSIDNNSERFVKWIQMNIDFHQTCMQGGGSIAPIEGGDDDPDGNGDDDPDGNGDDDPDGNGDDDSDEDSWWDRFVDWLTGSDGNGDGGSDGNGDGGSDGNGDGGSDGNGDGGSDGNGGPPKDKDTRINPNDGGVEVYHPKKGWIPIESIPDHYRIQRGVEFSDCLSDDSFCQTCNNAEQFLGKTFDECLSSPAGGDSYFCESVFGKSDCCSNPDAFPVNPGLIIPNPNGDLMCYGDIDVDFQQESCQKKCSIASYQEDCHSSCMSSRTPNLTAFAFDSYCLYAYTLDGCKPLGLPEPQRDSPPGRGPPTPEFLTQYANGLEQHLLFPSLEVNVEIDFEQTETIDAQTPDVPDIQTPDTKDPNRP